jgi:hypothetical protein
MRRIPLALAFALALALVPVWAQSKNKSTKSARRGGAQARDSALDHVARSDRVRGVLPSQPTTAGVTAITRAGMLVWVVVLCVSDRQTD